jgi:hypothetical protein
MAFLTATRFVNKAEKEYYLKGVETFVVDQFGTIPQILFTDHYKNLNGFSGCKPTYDARGVLESYCTSQEILPVTRMGLMQQVASHLVSVLRKGT